MHPLLFEIGPIHIRTYGVLLSLAFLIGVWLAAKRGRDRGVAPSFIYDLAIVIILSAIAGSRIYYVVVHYDSFAVDPLSALRIWEGGLSMYGGFIAALLASYLYSSSKGLSFRKVADIVAPTLAIGVAITRVGCFFNGCCFGKATTFFAGVEFPPFSEAGRVFGTVPVHPTQLYASLLALGILWVLIRIDRRNSPEGTLFGAFLVLYSILRFVIDFARYYSVRSTFEFMEIVLTYNQIISLLLLIFGILFLRHSPIALREESREMEKG